MSAPLGPIGTAIGQPIVFRTTARPVYDATLRSGCLWLRSDEYFRQLEDSVRNDCSEGINAGTTTVPLRFQTPDGASVQIEGNGHIGQQIVPHYMLCMHGSSISAEQLDAFGGCTFGITNIAKLAAEILYRCSMQADVTGYRYGQVTYQHTALSLLHSVRGSAAIKLCKAPPLYLNPIDTHVLRKAPLRPFIEQDEWRIVVFTGHYLNDDPLAPFQVNVSPHHFFPYIAGADT